MCNAVAPHKDVDGFNIVNIGRFCLDMQCLGPCTPLGVHELIRRTGITIAYFKNISLFNLELFYIDFELI